LDDPILLPGGRELVTLRDAGDSITSLPRTEQDIEEWQTAIGCLIGAAEGRDLLMHPGVGVMRAVNRHVERGFAAPRKHTHWGTPALTGSADIKLNTRLSLRAPTEKIASRTGYFP
jgi:hypothetical protein